MDPGTEFETMEILRLLQTDFVFHAVANQTLRSPLVYYQTVHKTQFPALAFHLILMLFRP